MGGSGWIVELPDDFILNIAIYDDDEGGDDDTKLYSKCYQASDLWQQLDFTSELESDL